MKVSILTGGRDAHYALGLLSGLLSKGVEIEFIANDYMSQSSLVNSSDVIFFNLRGNQNTKASILQKVSRVLLYYGRLMLYAKNTKAEIFHILWLNKFESFDRIILNAYYKLMGKKLIYTAHNINKEQRDNKDSMFNRYTLRVMYRLFDHIFVHTKAMKTQLIEHFGVEEEKISVIPFGINNVVPTTNLNRIESRKKIGVGAQEKILLFFGNIAPYKGLEYLIDAMPTLLKNFPEIKLIIAGSVKTKEYISYWGMLKKKIEESHLEDNIILKNEYIEEQDIEVYFKSADVLVLPYRFIFQTGVMFLAYYFGLPVVATDVGSIKEDILVGETGFVCSPECPDGLAAVIERYFFSDLYRNIDVRQTRIREYAMARHSWDVIGDLTVSVYRKMNDPWLNS